MGPGNWQVMPRTKSPSNVADGLASLAAFLAVAAAWASPAYAFQEHGAPEGLYIHQLAHIFFALSMTGLWYGIRSSKRFRDDRGWQLIAAGAALLTLWNVITFTGHILSIFIQSSQKQGADTIPLWMEWTWHILKLDNIVCVAAMLYFYAGLRKLLRSASVSTHGRRQVSP
jgi:hypothetical protein